MDQAHLCLKLEDLALLPMLPLGQFCHPHNRNKVGMVDTQAIFKVMDFTAAKLVANMAALVVSEVIKLLVKGTRVADMEATKVTEVTRGSVTANNVVDGVATMDINSSSQE